MMEGELIDLEYKATFVRQGNALKLLHGYTGPRGEDQEPGGGN